MSGRAAVRVGKGVPTGGQFAASTRSEAAVALDSTGGPVDEPVEERTGNPAGGRWPAQARMEDLSHLVEGYDPAADLFGRPGLRDAVFDLTPAFDLTRDAALTEPWEFTASMDWDDDEDDEADEHTAEYEALADAMLDDPDSVPPLIVVVGDDGSCRILDGNHRAGIGLARGIATWPAYVTRDPGYVTYGARR